MFSKEIFAERVRVASLDKGYTQEALGKVLGQTKVYVSGIEIGRRTTTVERLVDLADALEVSADYLLGRSDDPTRR